MKKSGQILSNAYEISISKADQTFKSRGIKENLELRSACDSPNVILIILRKCNSLYSRYTAIVKRSVDDDSRITILHRFINVSNLSDILSSNKMGCMDFRTPIPNIRLIVYRVFES